MSLREAAKAGDLRVVKIILSDVDSLLFLEDRSISSGVNPSQCDGQETALIQAAYNGHLACVKSICEDGYFRILSKELLKEAITAGNMFGENAFMWAAANGHIEIVKYLWTSVYWRIFGNDHEALLSELERRNHSHGINIRAGRRAIDSASARYHTDIVDFLTLPHLPT
jgi:ankyrin repeat protein